jgi:hypothetical protein
VALTGTLARGGGRACKLEGGSGSRRGAKARRVSRAWSGGLRHDHDRRPRHWGVRLMDSMRGCCSRASRGTGTVGEAAWGQLLREGTNRQAGLAEKQTYKIQNQNSKLMQT